jgi:hypothetical protein
MKPLTLFGLAFLLAGCGSPPAASSATQTSAAYVGDRGETLFRAKCNQCHAHPDPNKYTPTHWKRILVEMGRRAGLSPNEREDVLGYILTSRAPDAP